MKSSFKSDLVIVLEYTSSLQIQPKPLLLHGPNLTIDLSMVPLWTPCHYWACDTYLIEWLDSSHKVVGKERALFCLQLFDYPTWANTINYSSNCKIFWMEKVWKDDFLDSSIVKKA
jgi:hypothetical protein